MSAQITDRDYEQFSAYLDGQLAPGDLARLETRLKTDPPLRAALEELAATRTLLRGAKRLRAPRNFTISPEIARQYARKPLFAAIPGLQSLPAFRFSAALSALSLIAVLALEVAGLLPQIAANSTAMSPAAAPVMAPAPGAASERYAVEPTMAIQWQPGPPPASGQGGGPDSQSKAATGLGGGSGGGDSPDSSPIQGQVVLPPVSVQGLQNHNQSTVAPLAANPADQAASPILGVPAPGDGGKVISSNGTLEEIPTSALDQPAPEEGAAPLPPRRFVEMGLLALAIFAGLAAFLIRRSGSR